MANRCDINIRVIGDKDDIAAAERDLAAVFEGIWNYENSYDLIVVTKLDGVVYQTWYPWNPPGERLEEDVFDKYPNLIFLTAFSEDGMGFRGRVVWAYGYEVGYAAGKYGPDGDELYDSIAPLPDIFAPWLSPEEVRRLQHQVRNRDARALPSGKKRQPAASSSLLILIRAVASLFAIRFLSITLVVQAS